MNWRTLLAGVLVLAAVLAGVTLYRERSRNRAQGAGTYQPDYVLRDFSIVSLDPQGRENFTLDAPLLRRNVDTQAMDIDAPVFHFSDNQGRNWRAVSKTAWVSPKGEEVRLRGAAVVDSPDGTGKMTIKSEQMDVFTEKGKERAKTPLDVRVEQPGSIITAHGMDADLAGNRVDLLAQVRVTYESH